MIALTVNGVARRFDQPLNCQQLLERLRGALQGCTRPANARAIAVIHVETPNAGG